MKERLIKFPVPDYLTIFDNVETVEKTPFCICYQYDFNEDCYGPYGFDTASSKLLLKKIFINVKEIKNNSLIEADSFYRKLGLYFYGGFESLELLFSDVKKYYFKKKKQEFYIKRNIPVIDDLGDKPVLSDILVQDIFNSRAINLLIRQNIMFFIKHTLYPVAGDTFILFDDQTWEEIKVICNESSIEYFEAKSLDELKSW